VSFAGTVTVGVGFTVIVNAFVLPEQPFKVGTTEIVAVLGFKEELIAVNPGKIPVPLAPIPIEGVSVDQE
jgi:hypothetical protein